jgi:hypothetical protein
MIPLPNVGAVETILLQQELAVLLRQLVVKMMFNGFATERAGDSRSDHRIDDLVAGNLRGDKCAALGQLLIRKFHEPLA